MHYSLRLTHPTNTYIFSEIKYDSYNIIDDAVKELVKATSTVIDTIFNADSVLEVVTTGSVWRGRCNIHERFAASIIKIFPEVKVIFPRYEPAYGAALLALQTTQN